MIGDEKELVTRMIDSGFEVDEDQHEIGRSISDRELPDIVSAKVSENSLT